MTSKAFLGAFFVAFTALSATIVTVNFYLDIYGLFRPAAGRQISIYGEERIAKYLHSFRYIPENFDGVLLGSSASDNLDTSGFHSHRIYNASINGGNVEDVRPIADNVLASSSLRLVLICIHRYLTQDHVRKTDFMTTQEYWGALGSPQLLTAYISRMAIHFGVTQAHHDSWGTDHFDAYADPNGSAPIIRKAVADIQHGSKAVENYQIDPVAFNELRNLLVEARRPWRRLVVYYPPVPAPILELRSDALARYHAAIQTILRPGDVVVDFNTPAYAAFRADSRNYIDYSHLSKRGAGFLVAQLDRAVATSDSTLQATMK